MSELSLVDWMAISPLLILLGGALILVFFEAFFEQLSRKWAVCIAGTAILAALIAAIISPGSENPLLSSWIRFDAPARFFSALFLIIGLGCTLLTASFFQRFQASHGEYYFLLLSALFGLILIGSAADFLTLFLGLETLSLALYILAGYMKGWKSSSESAIKYFITGALATAFLLYGIALIYGAVGTTRFEGLLESYRMLGVGSSQNLFLGGMALVTLGLAFKGAVVPFHMWAPDVYSGTSTPVAAFMAVATKAGAFAAFTRIFLITLPQFSPIWAQSVAFLAIISMIYANIVALRQVQLRRFFAYSGISHAGFLLIPIVVGDAAALPALQFYLIVYSIATLGAFSVLALLDCKPEGVFLQDLQGLFQRAPFSAAVLTLSLLTLAGIPPTIGFFAKFYVFKDAFQAGYYLLVIVGLLTTIFSVFYYLRIVSVMFSASKEDKIAFIYSWPAMVVATLAFAAILLFSFYPEPLMLAATLF